MLISLITLIILLGGFILLASIMASISSKNTTSVLKQFSMLTEKLVRVLLNRK